MTKKTAMGTKSDKLPYKYEVVRKLIHLSSLSIPLTYYFIDNFTAVLILSLLFLAAIAIEIGRFRSESFGSLFDKIVGKLLREHESGNGQRKLSGATYVLASALLCVLLFPKIIAIAALAMFLVGDTAASLIGIKFGKHPFLKKSLEGTLAFIASAFLIFLVVPKVTGTLPEYGIGLAAAAAGAFIENISGGVMDDNLMVSMTIGAALWIGFEFFFANGSFSML